MKKLKYVGGGSAKKMKICGGDMWGGGSAKKIKYMGGVGEKMKICEGGSAKISIPPPLRISNGIALRTIRSADKTFYLHA